MPLKFVLLRSRLIPSLFAGSLLTGMDFLETLLLLFPTIPVIPAPCLLLRAGLPVAEGTGVFLSLTELPIRELLLELIRLAELPICGFCVVRVVGLLVLIELPIREVLPELIRLVELPICGFCVVRVVGLLILIELPIREVLPELIRLVELPICGFCVVRDVGLLILIELPIREVLPELIRLLELPTCGFVVLRTLGVLVLIELPIREDLPELRRLPELANDCLPVPELTAVGLLLLRELLDGLRVPDVVPGRVVTGRLAVTLPG